MEIYQIIDLLIKLSSSLAAGFGAYFIFWKYQNEKNRQVYEKRLNEVYVPLYSYLVEQETRRKIEWPECDDFEDEIILEPMNFNKQLTGINKGLAKPRLLKLIYQYLAFLQYNDKVSDENKEVYEWNICSVEIELVDEIINGYEETLKQLNIDSNDEIKGIKNFSLPEM